MKIVLDATVFEEPITGIAKLTLFLYRECVRMMPSLQIVGLHRRPLKLNINPPIEPVKIGGFLPHNMWRMFLLSPAMRFHPSTAVHFPWNGGIPRLSRKESVITTLHDVLPLTIPDFFQSDDGIIKYRNKIQTDFSRTHLLITDSEFSRKEISKHFVVKDEPVVISPGCTLEVNDAEHKTAQKPEGEYFLYVGGYDRRKGLEQLLKIHFSLHREKKISGKLILTGSPNYFSTTFERMVKDGILRGLVEEKGYVSDAALVELYLHAKALVYPSKYEGFGLPALEAMTLGCPVLTTKCTSLPEVCGGAACYIDPDNELEFARALVEVERNDGFRSELSHKGRQQSLKFTWEKSARAFLQAVEEMLRVRDGKRGKGNPHD